MATPLSVIALVSGGKDSLFSILHCLANGHTVVALANLHPPEDADEDMNSFMYQTVGFNAIPLYEQALGIPVYRQPIRGYAATQDKDYTQEENDETEALFPLLSAVKRKHPDANAVSTGAVLSTYQRTRVENVARRLDLTPLSFLWQYPFLPPYLESSLLRDMRNVGQVSKIIKVASGGLDESFLTEDVANQKTVTRMMKAIGRFKENGDGALLGEGGEFETLALDGPSQLWKKRIVLEPGEVIQQDGGSAIYKTVTSLAEKDPDDTIAPALRIPPLYDTEIREIYDDGLLHKYKNYSEDSDSDEPLEPISLPKNQHHDYGRTIVFGNLASENKSKNESLKSQFSNIIFRLNKMLELYKIPKTHITHCTLLLSNMDDFAEINALYAKFFNFTNPPSRITFSVGILMGEPINVMLTVTAHRQIPYERIGLHVQGRSYWAPANIGPYSQAISVPLFPLPDLPQGGVDPDLVGHEVHVAGQIGLDPASMALHRTDGFAGQTLLSLQHLFRIGRVQHVKWWIAGIALVEGTYDAPHERIAFVQGAWKALHEKYWAMQGDEDFSDEETDPWHKKNFSKAFEDRVKRASVADYRIFNPHKTIDQPVRPPPCLVVEVGALPMDARIEWACTGLTAPYLKQAYVGEGEHQNNAVRVLKEFALSHPRDAFSYHVIEIPKRAGWWDDDYSLRGVRSGTLYATAGPWKWGRMEALKKGITWVPCTRVWGEGGREIAGVLVGRKI